MSSTLPLIELTSFDSVTPHIPAMLRAARRILRSEDLAWDAVQEVLLQVWRNGRLPAEPLGVLRKLVRLRCLHLRRGHDRQCQCEEQARELLAEVTRTPDEEVERSEARDEIHSALGRLSDEHRTVLSLVELEGLDYPAAAARLAVPVGTVRSRLHRARHALRIALGAETRGAA